MYAPDKQIDKQTDSNVLPTPTDRVDVGNYARLIQVQSYNVRNLGYCRDIQWGLTSIPQKQKQLEDNFNSIALIHYN